MWQQEGSAGVSPVQWTLVTDLRFVYDGWNLIAESESSTAVPAVSVAGGSPVLLRSYEWGLDLSGTEQGAGGVGGLLLIRHHTQLSTHSPLSTTLAPCYDGNGNITELVNLATAQIEARYEYNPFGQTVTLDGGALAAANPFRFSTKYEDAETGLLYYGYRYYSPGTGTWLSKDRIEESGGINLYAAVINNPINRIDRLGLLSDEFVFLALLNHWESPNGNAPFVRFGIDWSVWMARKETLRKVAKSELQARARAILNGSEPEGYFRSVSAHTSIDSDSFLLSSVLNSVSYRIGGYANCQLRQYVVNGTIQTLECVRFSSLQHEIRDDVRWHPEAHPVTDVPGKIVEELAESLWPGNSPPMQGFKVHIYGDVPVNLSYCKACDGTHSWLSISWPINPCF